MKGAFLVAAAAAVGVAEAAAKYDIRPRMLQEEIDFTSAAFSCAPAGVCSSTANNCLSIAPLVAVETAYCRVIFAPDQNVVGLDASNGESLGLLALLTDSPLDSALDAKICAAFNNDTFSQQCVVKTPLRAITATMWGERHGLCKDFNTAILSMVNAPGDDGDDSNSTDFVPSATASATQIAVITQTMQGIMDMMGGAGAGANMTAALTALGVGWEDFVGPIVGLIPTNNAATAIPGAATACFVQHATNTQVALDSSIGVLIGSILAGANVSETDLQNAIVADAQTDAISAYLTSIASSVSVTMLGLITAGITGATNETETEAAISGQVVTEALAANNDTSTKIAEFFGYTIANNVNMSDTTEVGTAVATVCSGDGTCMGALGADIDELATSIDTIGGAAGLAIGNAEGSITGLIMTSKYAQFAFGFEAHMDQCFPMDAIEDFTDMMSRLAAQQGTADDMMLAQKIALSVGCQLAANDATENADTSLASFQSCYIVSVATNAPAVFAAMTSSPMSFTEELVYSLTDSTGNLESRCEAAGVPLEEAFPTYVVVPTGAPTTPGPTGAPTTPAPTDAPTPEGPSASPTTAAPTTSPTVDLSAGSSLGASLVAALALMTLAFF